MQTFNYQAITKMPQYQAKSFEVNPETLAAFALIPSPRWPLSAYYRCPLLQELRYEDYAKGNKGTTPAAPAFGATATSPFGAPAPAAASPFGAPAGTAIFGLPTMAAVWPQPHPRL